MRIFFVGYMGSGKSEAAKMLADRMGYDYIDADHLIEIETGKSINQIFKDSGEAKFREIENIILHRIIDKEKCVIATGGGLPCFYDNIKTLNNSGISIYLKAGAEVLSDRLFPEKNKRPRIRNINSLGELRDFVDLELHKRSHYYEMATLTVDAENDTETIINTVLNEIKSILPEQNPEAGKD